MSEEDYKNMDYCRRSWKWVLIPPVVILLILLVGYVVMQLWNAIIPGLFPNVGTLTYWHAVGLLVLCKILFGGFRRGCGGGWKGKYRMHAALKEKWMQMSDEEKAKFKEEWKARCHGK